MADAEIIPFQPSGRRPGRRPGRRTKTTPQARGLSFTQAMDSWELALNSRDRSAGTIRSYRDSIRDFTGWLAQRDLCICARPDPVEPCPVRPDSRTNGPAPTVEAVDVEDIRLYLVHERLRTSAGNAHKAFRNLRAFYRWLIKQGDLEAPGPVDNDDAPKVKAKVFPPLEDAEINLLLKTCRNGTSFEDLRDYAVMRLLLDIGPRAEGLAGIRYTPDDPGANDVYLSRYLIRIILKGGDEYIAPIGKKTAEAIDRYVRRARTAHPYADEPWLWLGRWGHFTKSGVQQMLHQRADQAGVADIYPHRFRRTAATNCVDSGQSETDVMHNFGWKTTDMVRRYTKATAKDRARRNHQRSSPADRY